MAIRNRTFTVPAGTVLRDGFVVPDTVRVTIPYDDAETTRGAAQKRAGQLAVDQLATRYGRDRKAIGGFSGVQKATAEVQRATPTRGKGAETPAAPRARGGRKQTAPRFEKVKKPGGVVVLRLTNAKTVANLPDAIRQLVAKAFALPRVRAVSLVASVRVPEDVWDELNIDGSPKGRANKLKSAMEDVKEPPTSYVEVYGQTASVNSLAAWDRLYPSVSALEEQMEIPIIPNGDYEVFARVGGK